MPGFQHIDDRSLAGLYAWLAGKPANPNRRPPAFLNEQKMPEGPVVASGGAPLPEGESQRTPGARNTGMRDYPAGIPVPTNRYTSDYGLQHSDLMSPVWSSILAYDMNKGTVLWRKPLGQDARIEKQGGTNTGIPIGSQRKGMIVTATGIVFATAKGGKLYAFDANNGELLWTAELSHETQGLPAMYAAKGKQYIVVSATAPFTEESIDKSKAPGALPRGYVAYALP
jgi:quinoprotein glucose dehydrogenase